MRSNQALRELIEAVTNRPGYSRYVGTRIGEVSAGKVAMRLDRRPELLQSSGYFHGGVISGLADHAAGAAVTSALPPERFCLTVNLQVNFLAPADGVRLEARAEAIKMSGSVCSADVRVFSLRADDSETLCAVAFVTLRVVSMPAAPDASPARGAS
jgi:uncharacterized protein (TIGR00369 family)